MYSNSSILIFTDLDGTLLNRDNFKFESTKPFLKELKKKNIIISSTLIRKKIREGKIREANKLLNRNWSVDGKVIAMQHPHQATGIFHSFVESDGLVELDENINYIKKGMLIKFFPFNER